MFRHLAELVVSGPPSGALRPASFRDRRQFRPAADALGGAPSHQSFDGPSWIAVYRVAHSRRDLFGNQVGLSERDTVAAAEVNGRVIFGTNSDALTYSSSDRVSAQRYVDVLVEKYPKTMSVENIGGIPNNSLYHAESTILLRAARDNGGTLAGRTLEIHVDRPVCWSCDVALPMLGLELGNPTITLVEPGGAARTMRNGDWLDQVRP